MKLKEKTYSLLLERIDAIINTAEYMETEYRQELQSVHPAYRKSAVNLIHYMALRSHYISDLQRELRFLGLPGLDNVEAHVMRSLLVVKTILNHLLGEPRYEHRKGTMSIKKSGKVLNTNTKALFGYKSKKRRTRIMVTLPNTAANDRAFINDLVQLGMNSARINCAHDTTETWKKMIDNVREAGIRKGRNVKVMMDLGGPKLRTGSMSPGPQVIHIRPEKDAVGRTKGMAKIFLATDNVHIPSTEKVQIIPMEEEWMLLLQTGDKLKFTDSRGKNCVIEVGKKEGKGRWASCKSSCYIIPETTLELEKHKGKVNHIEIGELEAFEQEIKLNIGDNLIIHKDPRPGEPASFNADGTLLQPAHISCTLPEIFNDVKTGEPIMFDDGKVEGIIREVSQDELSVEIIHAKEGGSKLKSDKGINLPESNLSISGLTKKDTIDMKFVAHHADAVNLSFVNTKEDVRQLTDLLKEEGSEIGVILKIETRKGFDNLPGILLEAMKSYPIGVMIARGDLAVETGWKQIATIQEEILRICEAAHVPDIWATQVLENLAKKGTPSRAEITDAAASQRAECVMLNKGVYIRKAVKLLDRILRQMQSYQDKKETVLSKLDHARELSLERDYS